MGINKYKIVKLSDITEYLTDTSEYTKRKKIITNIKLTLVLYIFSFFEYKVKKQENKTTKGIKIGLYNLLINSSFASLVRFSSHSNS